ncbi:hypothetical protein [Leptolyngbya sp. O-77]|uniref:hypothetical protein n=1 Tax=Leptolyngbya sp. O-77 TaxID=1080068 RepID=UPI000B28B7C3|nr:hypothetical protein [Leptolyngbya sp. O-77]
MQRGVSLRDRPSSPNSHTSRRSPFISPTPKPLGDRPPDTSRNLERLTQTYHRSTLASYPKAVGSVRVDRALEELNLRNWGANRSPTRKLTEPER